MFKCNDKGGGAEKCALRKEASVFRSEAVCRKEICGGPNGSQNIWIRKRFPVIAIEFNNYMNFLVMLLDFCDPIPTLMRFLLLTR